MYNDHRPESTTFGDNDFTNLVPIGRGSEAIVYNGLSGQFGEVAIKVFQGAISVTDSKEVALLVKLSRHQNILSFYGIYVNKSGFQSHGYVMELMQNGSLHEVIYDDSQMYGARQVISWMQQIALGLAHLHKEGIIHRDIKPSNLLLGQTIDILKISDFGTARNIGTSLKQTFTACVGTLAYMAPEIVQQPVGRQKYSERADIYSFAITLWEISRRKTPYDHLGEVNYQLLSKVSLGERPEIDSHPISVEFDELIQKGWTNDPESRPKVAEFLKYAKRHAELGEDREIFGQGAPVPMNLGGYTLGFENGDFRQKHFDEIVILDVEANAWRRLSLKMPYEAHSFGAAFLDGEIYIVGGENAISTSIAYKLDSKNLNWERLEDMEEGRTDISNSTVVYDGSIWVIGGSTGHLLHNTVEAYDPTMRRWERKPQLNSLRGSAAAAVVKERLFVCGGYGFLLDDSMTVEYFDSELSKWTLCTAPLPEPRAEFAAIVQDSLLVLLGGRAFIDNTINMPSEIDIYGTSSVDAVWRSNTEDCDPKWSVLPSMKQARRWHTAAAVGGKLMVIGGFNDQDGDLSSVEIFDGEEWTDGPAIPQNLRGAALTLVPQKLAKKLLAKYGTH